MRGSAAGGRAAWLDACYGCPSFSILLFFSLFFLADASLAILIYRERGLLNMLAINYDYSGSGRVMGPLDRSIIVLEGIAWLP